MQQSSIEYRLKPDDQLCFIHLMKTAGTTFTSLIDAKFHTQEICPNPIYLAEICPEVKACKTPEAIANFLTRYRFIRDNFSYIEICQLLKKPVYLTILRDPVERTISFYEFIRRSNPLIQRSEGIDSYNILKHAASDNLLDFVRNPHPVIQAGVSNYQTRQLISPDAMSLNFQDEELLAIAKKNLEQFVLVGLTERFQETTFLLSYIFGWCPTINYQSRRVAPKILKLKKDNLSSDTIDAVLECNKLDIQLYEHAQTMFDAKFLQMLEELQAHYCPATSSLNLANSAEPLNYLELLEKHYENRYKELQITPLPTLNFDFRQPMSGTGWHLRSGEFNGLKPTANVFRWTGPGTTSTLDFPIASNGEDMIVEIHIIDAAAPDILDGLTLSINHDPILLKTAFRKKNKAILQGIIPKDSLATDKGFVRLTFEVNRTLSLVDRSKSKTHLTGLAFSRIQIFPSLSQREPAGYLEFPISFPADDSYWVEVAKFIEHHLQLGEKFAAPAEFFKQFPNQFYFYSLPFPDKSHVSWLIVHKSRVDEIDYPFLKWATKNLKAVFANPVFVIFSNRLDLRQISRFHPHVRSFWGNWLTLQLQKVITAR